MRPSITTLVTYLVVLNLCYSPLIMGYYGLEKQLKEIIEDIIEYRNPCTVAITGDKIIRYLTAQSGSTHPLLVITNATEVLTNYGPHEQEELIQKLFSKVTCVASITMHTDIKVRIGALKGQLASILTKVHITRFNAFFINLVPTSFELGNLNAYSSWQRMAIGYIILLKFGADSIVEGFYLSPHTSQILLTINISSNVVKSTQTIMDEAMNGTFKWELEGHIPVTRPKECSGRYPHCSAKNTDIVMSLVSHEKHDKSHRAGVPIRVEATDCFRHSLFVPIDSAGRKYIVFITSEYVTESSNPYFELDLIRTLIIPFSMKVWAMIFMSFLVLLVIMNQLSKKNPGGLFMRTVGNFIWLWRILIGQRDNSAGPWWVMKNRKHSVRVLICTWLLGSIVLRHLYKETFTKSNSPMRKFYRTSLHTLKDLNDFEIFLPVHSHSLDVLNEMVMTNDFSGYFALNYQTEYICSAADDDILLEPLCAVFQAIKMTNMYVRGQMRMNFFSQDDIEEVVKDELTRPRTALVTTNDMYRTYWDIVQNYMDRNPTGNKFVYQYDWSAYTDGLSHFCVNAGLNRRMFDVMIKRPIEAGLAGGLVKLWKTKWLKHEDGGFPTSSLDENQGFFRLSLNDSNIWLLFSTYLAMMTASSVVVALEWSIGMIRTGRFRMRRYKVSAMITGIRRGVRG